MPLRPRRSVQSGAIFRPNLARCRCRPAFLRTNRRFEILCDTLGAAYVASRTNTVLSAIPRASFPSGLLLVDGTATICEKRIWKATNFYFNLTAIDRSIDDRSRAL